MPDNNNGEEPPKLTPSTRSNSKRNLLELSSLLPIANDKLESSKWNKKWRREISRDFSVSAQDQVGRVREVILDRTARVLAMQQVAQLEPTFPIKIRFCAAVEDYEVAPDREKKSKGRKTVSLFVDPGANFLLTEVPKPLQVALMAGHYDKLTTLKDLYLWEIAECDQTREVLGELFEVL
ncbi:hypothetical protein BASA81_007370 [Batrachochytrium salamandrivorans]|nr:hypothetical protein BASA81_007370 [Batrachochytrium salamandrivorans]